MVTRNVVDMFVLYGVETVVVVVDVDTISGVAVDVFVLLGFNVVVVVVGVDVVDVLVFL